jgi:hypothetical protein
VREDWGGGGGMRVACTMRGSCLMVAAVMLLWYCHTVRVLATTDDEARVGAFISAQVLS